MSFAFSDRSKRRMDGVDSRLVKVLMLAIERTPIDFGVAWMGGVRTPEEQNELFKLGNSQKDGYTKLSKHQLGNAIDLNIFVKGKVVDDREMLCVVAGVMFTCAKAIGVDIRWGGMWKNRGDMRTNNFDDLYHFELCEN